MKYKALLFDLDGTLLDTTEGVIDAVKRTIIDNGFPMLDESILKKFVGPPMQKTLGEQFNLDEVRAMEVANEFRAIYKAYYLFEAFVYDGILSLLKSLNEAGFKIAVATNKSHQNAMEILEKFGIMRYCDYALGSDLEGKLNKTNIIDLCIKNIGCKKSETVLIGDSVFDLQGAENSEIDFIAVTYGFGFSKGEKISSRRCVYVADNVEELKLYLLDSRGQ